MARIRTIKPEYQNQESIGRLSRDARLLLLELLPQADDAGRLRDSPRVLVGTLFPYDDDAHAKFAGWMGELEREHLIARYTAAGQHYIQIAGWLDDLGPIGQRINRPSAVHLPGPDPAPDPTNTHGGLTEGSLNTHGALTPVPVPVSVSVPGTGTWDRDQEGEGEEDREKDRDSLSVLKPHGLSSQNTEEEAFADPNQIFLNDAEIAAEKLKAVEADALKVTNAVLKALGITSTFAKEQILAQAKIELQAHPGELDKVVQWLAASWMAYLFAAKNDRLKNPPCSPEKFFGEARWKNTVQWGFKRGFKPYTHDFDAYWKSLPPIPSLQPAQSRS